jgi:hypothetical protein
VKIVSPYEVFLTFEPWLRHFYAARHVFFSFSSQRQRRGGKNIENDPSVFLHLGGPVRQNFAELGGLFRADDAEARIFRELFCFKAAIWSAIS